MKKDSLYILTLVAISIIVFVTGYFSMNYLVKVSTNQFLEVQMESSKREAQEFSKLISIQIENGVDRDTVIDNIQKSIEGTNIESGFICMFDWSGVEICHPNPEKIGQQVNPNHSFVRPINDEINAEDFYNLLTKNREEVGGLRDFTSSEKNSEIIYLYPVENTDWIVAAHANIVRIDKHMKDLKINFILIYLLSSVVIILLSIITVRFLGSHYEKELENKNLHLIDEVLELSKLNVSLSNFKNKVYSSLNESSTTENGSHKNTETKRRILTYSRDKLISINVEDIAYINTENTITSITCLDGNVHTNNQTLDELFNSLDHSRFFRANRQYILSVKGIDEILRYGNNQLKIKTKPENHVIISKNRASDFKKWLNM